MVSESAALVATKWVGLAAAIWVQASAGNAYMFAFYSPSLKAVLHYNQLQLNNLGVAKDIGENVGLLAGLLCNKIPAWTLLYIGALAGFLGYGTLWLVVSGQIAPLPYWQMLVIQCIGSNSATWFNTAVLVTCMRNFPHSRGTVVGILKGFVGLSAAIFTQIYTALLADNANLLLLFLTVGPTAVCLASMLFVRPVPAVGEVRDPEERRNFHYVNAVCVAVAAYLLAINLTEELVEMQRLIPVILTAVMVVFLLAPLAIPIKTLSEECYGMNEAREPLLKETSAQDAPLMIQAPDEDTSSIEDDTRSIDEDQRSVEDDTRSIEEDPRSVEDVKSIEDDSRFVGDDFKVIEDDSRFIEDDTNFIRDDSRFIGDDSSSIQDDSSSIRDDSRFIEHVRSIRDDSRSVEAEASRQHHEPLDQAEKGKKVSLAADVTTRLNRREEDAETLLVVGEGAVKRPKRRPRRGEDFKLRQALVKADFWILFLTFFCGVGTGVTAINNLGQIGEAQGYDNVNIFVSLISIANFLGRLGGGSLSEHYIRTDAIPRTVWLALAQVILILVHLMFASALPGTLYVGSVLLGLCYGVHFSIMVPTASELFGLKHFGMIYNFLTIASPLGSFLFSGLIAGYLYDREAAKDSGVETYLQTKEVCNGAHCFRLTFYVMAGVAAFGVVLTTVLTYRIRRVYTALYRKSPHPSASDLKSLE